MPDYLVFNAATGEIIRGGSASTDHVELQAGSGEVAVEVPAGTLTWPTINIEPMRAEMLTAVDAAAGAFRTTFITDVPGQAETYLYKANEARAWTADNSITTHFLAPEAAARGMTIAALAAEVLAAEAKWQLLGGKIEAVRMGAKTAIVAANTIPAMVAAATVNWPAAVS